MANISKSGAAKKPSNMLRLRKRGSVQRPAYTEFHSIDDWSPDLQKSKAYEQILLDITLGVLPPNARVDEQGLADRYGIGLAGVRDALGRLALEGMVQRRARSGTVITPLDVEEFDDSFAVRRLLEPEGASLAARHATEDEIKTIITALDHADQAIEKQDFRSLLIMDKRFHRAVAVASHNVTLARIVIALHHKAARYWYHSMVSRPIEERIEDVAAHRAVAEAIAARDPDKAGTAMILVLGGASDSLDLDD